MHLTLMALQNGTHIRCSNRHRPRTKVELRILHSSHRPADFSSIKTATLRLLFLQTKEDPLQGRHFRFGMLLVLVI